MRNSEERRAEFVPRLTLLAGTAKMSPQPNRKMPKTAAQPKVFSHDGAIDLHVSPAVRAALREIIDEKPKRLVVDMSRVPYVDSSGLAVLIGAKQELEADGGTFVLAGPQQAVRTILESARLDQYFRLVPDLDSATGGR